MMTRTIIAQMRRLREKVFKVLSENVCVKEKRDEKKTAGRSGGRRPPGADKKVIRQKRRIFNRSGKFSSPGGDPREPRERRKRGGRKKGAGR
jgi:hypothetical protein